MRNDIGLGELSDTVHPYPTFAYAARRAADQYYVRKQKRWMSRLVQRWHRYRGKIPNYVGTDEVI